MIQRRKIDLPLENGECVGWPEFERRAAFNTERKIELIDGVVYMPPPVGPEHGDPHLLLGAWLVNYSARTRGTRATCESTLRLGQKNAPQPDAGLRILPEAGGCSRYDEKGYIVGGVELVLEVARSSTSLDLGKKKDLYYDQGCLEYLVYVVHDREVLWFSHEEQGYVPLDADERGIVRSRVFPGLWLDTKALAAKDGKRLLETVNQGLATAEHAEFAAKLAARLGSS